METLRPAVSWVYEWVTAVVHIAADNLLITVVVIVVVAAIWIVTEGANRRDRTSAGLPNGDAE